MIIMEMMLTGFARCAQVPALGALLTQNHAPNVSDPIFSAALNARPLVQREPGLTKAPIHAVLADPRVIFAKAEPKYAHHVHHPIF